MDRAVLLRRALLLSILSILINGIFGGTAVVVGLTSGSLALIGFGVDAAIDSAASVALVWRFRIEATQPHRAERVETAAEVIVGVVLITLGAYLFANAVSALAAGRHPEPSLAGTALLVASMVVLPPLALAKSRIAARLRSGALRADSFLTAIAAVLAVIGFAGTIMAVAFAVAWADSVGALIVAAIVVREGWGSVRAARAHQPLA